jgi:dihydroorotase
MIVTDHAPHSKEEKDKGILGGAPSGMIGLELSLAMGITHLVEKGHLSYMELLEKMTINPAKYYKLDAGYIAKDHIADIVIFDPKKQWVVTLDDFKGKSKNSPFVGEHLTGQVAYTICNGKIVYKKGS